MQFSLDSNNKITHNIPVNGFKIFLDRREQSELDTITWYGKSYFGSLDQLKILLDQLTIKPTSNYKIEIDSRYEPNFNYDDNTSIRTNEITFEITNVIYNFIKELR